VPLPCPIDEGRRRGWGAQRAMEERAVAVRVCHEMREERDAAVAAAAGLPPGEARHALRSSSHPSSAVK
jgi:hypothetical protein